MTASINADPFTFTGGARITAASVFALDGCVAVVVAGEADVGKTAPFCKDEQGNNASYVAQQPGLAVRVHGQGSIIGIPIPGNAYGQWTPPNNVSVRGHIGYTAPARDRHGHDLRRPVRGLPGRRLLAGGHDHRHHPEHHLRARSWAARA